MKVENRQSIIDNFQKTIDVCKKLVDLYYVTLQTVKHIGFDKAYVAIADEALNEKLVVRSSLNIDGVCKDGLRLFVS